MSDRSMQPVDEDVDVFIDTSSDADALRTLDDVIREALPGVSRTLWRGVLWGGAEQAIIGYGHITQPRPRGKSVEWFLVGLAQQKRHLSLYINAAEDGAYLAKHYAPRLGKVKTGSASITFARVADLDLGVMTEMLRHAARLMPPDQAMD